MELMSFESFMTEVLWFWCETSTIPVHHIFCIWNRLLIHLKGKSHELGTCELKHNTKEEDEFFFSG